MPRAQGGVKYGRSWAILWSVGEVTNGRSLSSQPIAVRCVDNLRKVEQRTKQRKVPMELPGVIGRVGLCPKSESIWDIVDEERTHIEDSIREEAEFLGKNPSQKMQPCSQIRPKKLSRSRVAKGRKKAGFREWDSGGTPEGRRQRYEDGEEADEISLDLSWARRRKF